jgi:hypothetical protein
MTESLDALKRDNKNLQDELAALRQKHEYTIL